MNEKFGCGATPLLTFVGNRAASALDLAQPAGKTLRQKYVVGEPQACPAGTADEMKRRGFVGIYSKQSEPLYHLPGSKRMFRKKW